MNSQILFWFILTVTTVSASRLPQVATSPSSDLDPDFINATLIRTFTTFQIITKTKIIDLINVPDVRQSNYYTCGPSCLQSILMYYGIEKIEFILAEMAKSTEQYGTNVDQLLRVAREFGLNAESHFNMTLSELQGYIDRKIPVIILIQAWRSQESKDMDWNQIWQDGHYVIAIGYDDKYIYIEDPSILGGIGYIPNQEFLSRWHDFDPYPFKKYIHYGMTIEGKNASVNTVEHIE